MHYFRKPANCRHKSGLVTRPSLRLKHSYASLSVFVVCFFHFQQCHSTSHLSWPVRAFIYASTDNDFVIVILESSNSVHSMDSIEPDASQFRLNFSKCITCQIGTANRTFHLSFTDSAIHCSLWLCSWLI